MGSWTKATDDGFANIVNHLFVKLIILHQFSPVENM